MLPAYAGMIPEALVAWDAKASAPRVCGDDPDAMMMLGIQAAVLPAYAGMIPSSCAPPTSSAGAPRVCGDDPGIKAVISGAGACSPRMRG